jgi:predicted DNA-binding transcriptional regulator AlpA
VEGTSLRALCAKEVCSKVGRKKTWLFERLRNDSDFPRPRYLGGRPVWFEHELDAWLVARPLIRERA